MKEKQDRSGETRHSDRAEFDDSDGVALDGMSAEGAAADEAETMASLGNSEGTFTDIAAGTATGMGIDRGASIGTGGLAAGEDLDPVAEGDYWRQNFRRDPYSEVGRPYARYAPGNRADGDGEDADRRELSLRDAESELERSWDARHGEHAQREQEESEDSPRPGH